MALPLNSRVIYSTSFLRGLSRSFYSSKSINSQLWTNLESIGILRKYRGTRAGKLVKSRLSRKLSKLIIQKDIYLNNSTTPECNSTETNTLQHKGTLMCKTKENFPIKGNQQHKGNLCKYSNTASTTESKTVFKFCLLNAHSAVNKSAILNDYLSFQNIDLAAITETWFTSNDSAVKTACIPDGFKILDFARTSRCGGGIAIAFRDSIGVSLINAAEKTSFEYAEWLLSIGSFRLLVSVIYRPPYSLNHPISTGTFLNEFSDYLESLMLCKHSLLISGDFNIHVDITSLPETKLFNELLFSFGLQQLVNFPTHEKGHTLDLIICRQSDSVYFSSLKPGSYISDHCTVLCDLNITKPRLTTKTITYRKLKDIDISALTNDLSSSGLFSQHADELSSLVRNYNLVLSELLDRHAPQKSKSLVIRPIVPWFNNEIRDSKRQQRKAERRWRSSRTDEHRMKFKEARNRTTFLMNRARQVFYTTFVQENSNDQRKLFMASKKLLNMKKDSSLPPYNSKEELANQFGGFFVSKINDIRSEIDNMTLEESCNLAPKQHYVGPQLTEFKPLSKEEIGSLITKAPAKSCILDPMPTPLVKQCMDILQPIVMEIINTSLVSGVFPDQWKEAIVLPLLKKANLETIFKNYRPVSNLPFLSKLCEKAVSNQIRAHLISNNLYPSLQSAYCSNHSTETALLKVRNDILLNMNRQQVTLLVLLDLSAAFDTIDHSILLDRLQSSFGITGHAFNWISSYLSGRSLRVSVEGSLSESFNMEYGVPQGSCLGPLLFTLYASEIFNIISYHLPDVHGFADDTQLYLAFKPDNKTDQEAAVSSMEHCINDIRRWMQTDKLKLNDGKTEFLIIGTKQQLEKVNVDHLTVGTEKISPTTSVRNLGSWFDECFNMSLHISKACSSSYYYLHNIRQIRKYLTPVTTETLIHAFVTSRLDYCNSLLYGLPASSLHKLQKVQNTAARLIQLLPRFCHITPVLKDLHWLPIKFRIQYKICILTYKVIHNMAPVYLKEMIHLSSNSRYSLRSTDTILLKKPTFKSYSTLGDRSFTVASPVLWNSLPSNIRLTEDFKSFKTLLKTYLFKLAF